MEVAFAVAADHTFVFLFTGTDNDWSARRASDELAFLFANDVNRVSSGCEVGTGLLAAHTRVPTDGERDWLRINW